MNCGCTKTRCSTNRCNCLKAELKCTNLSSCADSGDLCDNQLDTDAEDEEENGWSSKVVTVMRVIARLVAEIHYAKHRTDLFKFWWGRM